MNGVFLSGKHSISAGAQAHATVQKQTMGNGDHCPLLESGMRKKHALLDVEQRRPQ